MNQLDQLKAFSTVVADTGDIDAITKYQPQDATTNPSLILKAVQSGKYDNVFDATLKTIKAQSLTVGMAVEDTCDQLIVTMGSLILQNIPGRVSTEVSARLSFDTQASINKARKLINLYETGGITRDRILIKLAATWEGIRAAEVLEQEGINCNLTLIFSQVQARACAEAGAYLISPFVGRILDWHRKADPETSYEPANEPGVLSVQNIYKYFQQHLYSTVVMGASFRNKGEILALAGCDRLTISPDLLEELSSSDAPVERILFEGGQTSPRPQPMQEAEFRWLLNEDAMASEKLAEGIRNFEIDQRKLETLVKDRL